MMTIILHGYEDTGPQRFWGHDVDFLGSRDVIGYVTIRLSICHFLLVQVHCNQASDIAPLWRYKASKLRLAHVVGQNVDCACPVSRDLWAGGPK